MNNPLTPAEQVLGDALYTWAESLGVNPAMIRAYEVAPKLIAKFRPAIAAETLREAVKDLWKPGTNSIDSSMDADFWLTARADELEGRTDV